MKEPPLTADCPQGFSGFYMRDNMSGTLRCLTPEAPNLAKGKQICFSYAGTSEDGSRAFFAANAPYASVPPGSGFSLYEWSSTKGLQAISVLPGQSEATAGTAGSSFGAGSLGSFGEGLATCQLGQSTLRHVVSADGSKAFWTYVPEGEKPTTRLLARIDGTETLQLDALPTAQKVEKQGTGPAGNGVFWAASKDGSLAYFTDANRLIKGSKAEAGAPDLYRYELGAEEPLSDLTKASATGTAADVQGVIGASDDGSYLYFVAKGVLSEEDNAAGDKAEDGEDNLYLFHEDQTRFIATLSHEDERDWESQPKALSARVSPDGRHLAFLSSEAEALAGYDNTVANGEHCRWEPTEKKLFGSPLCPQAFLYDAETGALRCTSCNPSGARPLGPALLPGWSNPYEGPRYLSDDGQRLFFESFDALASADESAKRDIYEFERPGSGSCTSESPAFDPASGGCHYLISSGRSSDENYLVDASADGRDVFFSTRSRLVGWDTNDNYDVYDVREGGGFPEPAERPNCEGEACLSAVPAAPVTASPPRFESPGNPPQKHKTKKHRKKPKKHKAKKRHTGKASHKSGARR